MIYPSVRDIDCVSTVVRYNMYELFWEWQQHISYCSYNPHKMYVTTEKFAKAIYEYSCIIHDVFYLVESSIEWDDLMCLCDRMYRIMCDWLSGARANAYDSINRDTDFLGGYRMSVVERIAMMSSDAKRIYERAVETMDSPDWDDWSIDRQMAMLDWSIDIINRQMVKIRELMTQYQPFLFIQQFGQSKLDVLNQYVQKLVRKYEKLTDY